MARSKLVCNLGMADFFLLPDSSDVWRKKGGEPIYLTEDGKRTKGYACESLYDSSQQIWLPANQRVKLTDK